MTEDMWGTGDYRAVAEKVTSIGDVLVSRAAIEPGMEVLDVACGTGNAAIPAAKRGARVTGLDLSPGLIAIARERGAESDVSIEWLEGDAQALPFEDDSFDRVISAIGICSHRITGGQPTSCAVSVDEAGASPSRAGRPRAASAQCSSASA